MAVTEQQVLDTLKRIEDPSQGKDLVSLGLVDGVTVKESNIAVLLVVPPHRGPAMEPVRKLAEDALLALDGVTSASVIVTAHQSREETADTERQRQRGRKTFPPRCGGLLLLLPARAGSANPPPRLIWRLPSSSKDCASACLMLMSMARHSRA